VTYLLAHIRELAERLDYCGWGDSYERSLVEGDDGLRARTEKLLAEVQK
jgi:hypothetical protein